MPSRAITVLYIDDDAAIGRLVQRILGRRGYTIESVTSAQAGLARIAEGDVDVVICDHDLGTGSGLEVLEALAQRETPPPVVYVTASADLSIAVQALKAGAVDYVVKTIGEDFEVLLVAALEQSVQRARLMRAKEQAERDMRAAKEHAEALLAEVNHRVANSLALVSSLVRMQASSTAEKGARDALAETQARIAAIANLHRSLYTSDDVRSVDLSAYLSAIMGELEMSLSADGSLRLHLEAEPIQIRTDKAVSVGMIVTELITNAFKYAYPEGRGEVRVRVKRAGEHGVLLRVEDDGVGWNGEGPIKGSGLGSKIIGAMARSLATEIVYEPCEGGTRAVLRIGAVV